MGVILREIEVLLSQGQDLELACRDRGISTWSYYRWHREYGGMKVGQAKKPVTTGLP
jgi:uncharacterized protein YegJ (DUF2314 family)